MHHQRFTIPALLAGLLALGFGAPAWSQDGDDAAAGADSVSDEELEQFVVAMSEIREIRMEYAPKLQEAESEEEQNQVRKEGREEMINAIEDSGLEADEYNQIGQSINNDEDLERRVRDMMQEEQGSS